MRDWEWDPDTYMETMREEIPGYEELQSAVATACTGIAAVDVLELGTGTGETAVRVLALHPQARWTGVDAGENMIGRARERLPNAEFVVARLEDPLPPGPFDLVVSCLTVHHLPGPVKRDLFQRLSSVLRPTGQFVLGDLVVPKRGSLGVIAVDWEMDVPSSVAEQLVWLREAGFEAQAEYVRADLAVFRAQLTAVSA